MAQEKTNNKSTGVPNSNDLFKIYESHLNTISSIHKIIVTNKMDKKMYKAIQDNVKMTSKLVEAIFKNFDIMSGLLSSASASINSTSIQKTMANVEEVIQSVAALSVYKLNIKSIIHARVAIKLLGGVMGSIMDLFEGLGGYNTGRISLATANMRLVGATIEEMLMITAPLPKISIRTMISNRIRIWLMRRLFRRIFDFITDVGRIYKPTSVLAGTATIALVGYAMEYAFVSVEKISGISLFKLIRTNLALKRLGRILFGKYKYMTFGFRDFRMRIEINKVGMFDIVRQAGSFPIVYTLLAIANLKLVEKVFDMLDDTLDSIVTVGFFKAIRTRKALKRISKVLFGKHKTIRLGWGKIGLTMNINKMGIFDLIRAVGAEDPRISIRAATTMLALQIFFKSFRGTLKSIRFVSGLRALLANVALKNIAKILFGKKTIISIATARGRLVFVRSRMGLFDIVMAAGMYNPVHILKGTANIALISLTLFRLNGAIIGLALISPLTPLAWLASKLINSVIFNLMNAYLFVGMRYRVINRGTKAIQRIVKVILGFAASVLLAGALFALALPLVILTGVVIAAYVGIFILISKQWTRIYRGALAMGMLSLALLGFAISLLVAGAALQRIDWKQMGILLITIGVLVGIAALAGLGFEFVILGAIAIGALGIALLPFSISLLMFANALETLSNVDVDGNALRNVIEMLVDGVSVFFEGDNIKYLNPFTLGYVSLCMMYMMGIVMSVGKMAKVMQNISSLNIPVEWDSEGNPVRYERMKNQDFTDAATNGVSILRFFTALFGDEPTVLPNGVVVYGAMNDIKNIEFGAKTKVRRLSKIVGYVGNMAKTLQDIANLTIPISYDDKGKPTGYRSMTPTDFTNAATITSSILTFFASIFADKAVSVKVLGQTIKLGVQNSLMASLDNISRSTKRKVKRLSKIVGYVGDMATTLQNVATLTIPSEIDESTGKPKKFRQMTPEDFEAASKNVATIATTLVGAVADEGLASKLDNMSKKATKNFSRILTPMSSITGIVEAIQLMAGGEYVKTWKTTKDGERVPDEYESFIKLLDRKADIQTNLTSMLTIVIGAISQFESNDYYSDMLSDAEDAIDDLSKVSTGATPIIQGMMDMYTNTGIKDINPDEYRTRMRAPLDIMKDMVSHVAGASTKANASKLDKIGKNVDSVKELMKQVDRTDLNKLKTAANMMQHIADLSRSIHGNFEDLADVIKNELLEVLTKLTDTLDGIKNTNSSSGAGSLADIAPARGGIKGVVDNSKKEDNNNKPKNPISSQDIQSIRNSLTTISAILSNVTTYNAVRMAKP